MINYRKSFLIQLFDENTLKIGPVLQVYGNSLKEATNEHVNKLSKKYPGFIFELIMDNYFDGRLKQ